MTRICLGVHGALGRGRFLGSTECRCVWARQRKTIVRGIESLGHRRSCYDPCIFCLTGESGPQGHILIEVDDLATHANAVHAANMANLQKIFKFGKWKSIYNSEGDYAERSYKINLMVFMSIRKSLCKRDCLHKKSETTEGEKRQLRAV